MRKSEEKLPPHCVALTFLLGTKNPLQKKGCKIRHRLFSSCTQVSTRVHALKRRLFRMKIMLLPRVKKMKATLSLSALDYVNSFSLAKKSNSIMQELE